jgi:hypothetical protein
VHTVTAQKDENDGPKKKEPEDEEDNMEHDQERVRYCGWVVRPSGVGVRSPCNLWPCGPVPTHAGILQDCA